MAFLKGRIPGGVIPERWYDLEITAIRPSVEGPRDAYQVVVRRNGDQVFEQTYSVQNFTGGHYVMWQMSNLLRHAPDIMDKKPELPPIALPAEAWCTATDWPVSLREDATWMSIVLSGSTSRRGERGFLVTVNLSVEPISDFAHEPGAALNQFVSFHLYTTPEEVAQFGEALEAELVEARRLRDALNLPAAFEA
jgi:hypothetical protein